MNLIHICVSYNKNYINLLRLLLISIKKYTPLENVHIAITTCNDLQSLVIELIEELHIPHVKVYPATNKAIEYRLGHDARLLDAASQKMLLLEHIEDKYDKILYLDTDILMTGDLSPVFDIELGHKLHALPEGRIQLLKAGPWGGMFFRNHRSHLGKPGINTGIMLYNNCPKIRDLFNQTMHHIYKYLKTTRRIPGCKEQPFLVFNSVICEMCETSTLPEYAMLHPNPHPEETIKLINHFSGWVGNDKYKIKKMEMFFNKNIQI